MKKQCILCGKIEKLTQTNICQECKNDLSKNNFEIDNSLEKGIINIRNKNSKKE